MRPLKFIKAKTAAVIVITIFLVVLFFMKLLFDGQVELVIIFLLNHYVKV
jgi:hypothetical protein